ncbi:type II secretion system F family protein [Candidatus Babela massiliensis]|uniref:Type II secretory pathway component PulF n=1 Tax=Candidatus Babela massiliensis TaxID=673862 RepID=V6DI12_9BACT|nr:type II secretion system F family protein [Candidatus Babela massiliensis]CDK30568.1 Type II secretory pathway component PulF [Candidatus Babela massiliensis]
MPYFFWSGINLNGESISGKLFARSIQDLDRYLFNQEIALLNAKEYKIHFILAFSLSNIDENKFIEHISILLNAGIHLHKALEIVSKTIKNKYYKIIINDIKRYVYEGEKLSYALEVHKNHFNILTRSIIYSGEISSNLNLAFNQLVKHNKIMNEFKKKLKSTLLIPIITLILFIIIFFGLLILIIPRFEAFFNSIDKNALSKSTKLILKLSKLIRSKKVLYISTGLLTILIILKNINIEMIKIYKYKILLNIPVISNFLFLIYTARFLQKLDLLLTSGLHITKSIEVIIESTQNLTLRDEIKKILNKMNSGHNLSLSISQSQIFNSEELFALIKVGESSGNLIFSINQASEIYQNKVYNNINKFIFLVQPLILIILGLLISGLIISIYVPLINLSSAIH